MGNKDVSKYIELTKRLGREKERKGSANVFFRSIEPLPWFLEISRLVAASLCIKEPEPYFILVACGEMVEMKGNESNGNRGRITKQ